VCVCIVMGFLPKWRSYNAAEWVEVPAASASDGSRIRNHRPKPRIVTARAFRSLKSRTRTRCAGAVTAAASRGDLARAFR